MGKAALELILFVALEAKRFRRLHKPRNSSFGRDLMAKLAQILFREQTIYFCRHHSFMTVGASLSPQGIMRLDQRNRVCRWFQLLGGKGRA
jgi:hypothetical protein